MLSRSDLNKPYRSGSQILNEKIRTTNQEETNDLLAAKREEQREDALRTIRRLALVCVDDVLILGSLELVDKTT